MLTEILKQKTYGKYLKNCDESFHMSTYISNVDMKLEEKHRLLSTTAVREVNMNGDNPKVVQEGGVGRLRMELRKKRIH